MSDSEEDDFVTIGNPLPPYDENEVPKKPVHVTQLNVNDPRGRPRFHGAFTGGFSAGYFNTVGTKEGWTPSAFVSSRDRNDGEDTAIQRPEDFMDDEDVGEHGIAPRQVALASDYHQQDRKRKSAAHAQSSAIIPGQAPLQDLIVPSSIPMGIQLLRKLGWKEGQGIGPRVIRKGKEKTVAGKKVYGCAMPQADSDSESSGDDFIPDNVTFAPKDINPIRFRVKDDRHGLGYSGINMTSALGGGSGHINLFEPVPDTAPKRPAGVNFKSKRGMGGAAFGVGALEDDDEDVYAMDSMANYDRVLTDNTDKTFGWTAPKHQGMSAAPVGYIGKVLEGFKLSSSTLKPKQTFPPPKLPRDYKPHRKRNEGQGGSQSQSGNVANARSQTGSSSAPANKKIDANVRSAMLGELNSVFDLVGQKDKERIQTIKSEPTEFHPPQQSPQPSTSTSGQSAPSLTLEDQRAGNVPLNRGSAGFKPFSFSTSTSSQSASSQTLEDQRASNVPLNRGSAGFKPFARDPAKQQRYEEYLELKKQGVKYEPAGASMTEWERHKEQQDFARAAALYRPMSTMMASRFTSAQYADDVKNVDMTPKDEKPDERKKAVEMKMFGRLTRECYEWHPDKVLCKRFNIANPYPESSMVGVPGGTKRDKFASYCFEEPEEKPAPEEEMATETPVKPEPVQSDIKPLAILAGGEGVLQSVSAPSGASQQQRDVHVDLTDEAENNQVKEENKERPSMDIFKAIFSNSEDSSDSSEDERENQGASISAITPQSSSSATENLVTEHLDKDKEQEGQHQPKSSGTITIDSLDERLSPPVTESNGDVIYNVTLQPDSYGPALPPSVTAGSASESENSSKTKKSKEKRKRKDKHKDKKKKSKHKKNKDKDKKKKKKKEKKKEKKKKVITISSGSSSSGSEADEDTDSEPSHQPSDTHLLNKLKNHPGLKRMTASDFW